MVSFLCFLKYESRFLGSRDYFVISTTFSQLISPINTDLSYNAEETKIGTYLGKDLYRKVYSASNVSIAPGATVIDANLNKSYVSNIVNLYGSSTNQDNQTVPANYSYSNSIFTYLQVDTRGFLLISAGHTAIAYDFVVEYTKE